METRISNLETGMQDVRERLTRIEAISTTFATKEDIQTLRVESEKLRTDMHKEFNSQTWKFITFTTTVAGILVGIVYGIARYVH